MYISKGEKRSRFKQQTISRTNHIALIDIENILECRSRDDFELVRDIKKSPFRCEMKGHKRHTVFKRSTCNNQRKNVQI
jgi:hypothetical protein